ncbi:MAG: carbonate dehydratase [Alphaproteobacteria bacterium]|nr:carbonate dehydratase [Alphaproteobacteria bacterium]
MEHLLKRNVAWAAERKAADPDYFRRLSNLQAPEYLWIGCSDSRVPANVITGLQPGEVFVHRNVANLVNPGDLNCLSVLQFAIEVLRVKHIIVCGHYGCGGIRAATDGGRHGLVDYWINPIRDLAEAHSAELGRLGDTARQNRLCELSVATQVRRVAETPIVQDAWARGQSLKIHGWVYDLNDGLLRDLDCTQPP